MVVTTPSCTVPILKASPSGPPQTTAIYRWNWKGRTLITWDDVTGIAVTKKAHQREYTVAIYTVAKAYKTVEKNSPLPGVRPLFRNITFHREQSHVPHHLHQSKSHSVSFQPPTSVRGLGLGSGQPWLSATLRFGSSACEAMAEENSKNRLGLLHCVCMPAHLLFSLTTKIPPQNPLCSEGTIPLSLLTEYLLRTSQSKQQVCRHADAVQQAQSTLAILLCHCLTGTGPKAQRC